MGHFYGAFQSLQFLWCSSTIYIVIVYERHIDNYRMEINVITLTRRKRDKNVWFLSYVEPKRLHFGHNSAQLAANLSNEMFDNITIACGRQLKSCNFIDMREWISANIQFQHIEWYALI